MNQASRQAAALLMQAIEESNEEGVAKLLGQGVPVNFADTEKKLTPLHCAVSRGDTGIVALLLRYRANVNSRDGNLETPLHIASAAGDVDIVRLLLENGANLSARTRGAKDAKEGATPLSIAKNSKVKAAMHPFAASEKITPRTILLPVTLPSLLVLSPRVPVTGTVGDLSWLVWNKLCDYSHYGAAARASGQYVLAARNTLLTDLTRLLVDVDEIRRYMDGRLLSSPVRLACLNEVEDPVSNEIAALIGRPLGSLTFLADPEVHAFRDAWHRGRYRKIVARLEQDPSVVLSPAITTAPLPSALTAAAASSFVWFHVTGHECQVHKTMRWNLRRTPAETLAWLANENQKVFKDSRVGLPEPHRHVLKMWGRQDDYLVGPTPLFEFTSVRLCMLQGKRIHVAMALLPGLEQEVPRINTPDARDAGVADDDDDSASDVLSPMEGGSSALTPEQLAMWDADDKHLAAQRQRMLEALIAERNGPLHSDISVAHGGVLRSADGELPAALSLRPRSPAGVDVLRPAQRALDWSSRRLGSFQPDNDADIAAALEASTLRPPEEPRPVLNDIKRITAETTSLLLKRQSVMLDPVEGPAGDDDETTLRDLMPMSEREGAEVLRALDEALLDQSISRSRTPNPMMDSDEDLEDSAALDVSLTSNPSKDELTVPSPLTGRSPTSAQTLGPPSRPAPSPGPRRHTDISGPSDSPVLGSAPSEPSVVPPTPLGDRSRRAVTMSAGSIQDGARGPQRRPRPLSTRDRGEGFHVTDTDLAELDAVMALMDGLTERGDNPHPSDKFRALAETSAIQSLNAVFDEALSLEVPAPAPSSAPKTSPMRVRPTPGPKPVIVPKLSNGVSADGAAAHDTAAAPLANGDNKAAPGGAKPVLKRWPPEGTKQDDAPAPRSPQPASAETKTGAVSAARSLWGPSVGEARTTGHPPERVTRTAPIPAAAPAPGANGLSPDTRQRATTFSPLAKPFKRASSESIAQPVASTSLTPGIAFAALVTSDGSTTSTATTASTVSTGSSPTSPSTLSTTPPGSSTTTNGSPASSPGRNFKTRPGPSEPVIERKVIAGRVWPPPKEPKDESPSYTAWPALDPTTPANRRFATTLEGFDAARQRASTTLDVDRSGDDVPKQRGLTISDAARSGLRADGTPSSPKPIPRRVTPRADSQTTLDDSPGRPPVPPRRSPRDDVADGNDTPPPADFRGGMSALVTTPVRPPRRVTSNAFSPRTPGTPGTSATSGTPQPPWAIEARRAAASRKAREEGDRQGEPSGARVSPSASVSSGSSANAGVRSRAPSGRSVSSGGDAGADAPVGASLWDLDFPFRVRVDGIDHIKVEALRTAMALTRGQKKDTFGAASVYVHVELYHGTAMLVPPVSTRPRPLSTAVRWNEWVTFRRPAPRLDRRASFMGGKPAEAPRAPEFFLFSDVPLAARLCLTVFACVGFDPRPAFDTPIGWVACQVIDYARLLRQGQLLLTLWPAERANPIGSTALEMDPLVAVPVRIAFPRFAGPIYFPTFDYTALSEDALVDPTALSFTNEEDLKRLNQIWSTDPLYKLTPEDCQLLHIYRGHARVSRRPPTKYLKTIDHSRRAAVWESHRMLSSWPFPDDPRDCMALLGPDFADVDARAYGVRALLALSDDEFLLFVLQFVQALLYEPCHDSALARLLLWRALSSRRVGHAVFWTLRSELHRPEARVRFGLILEAYLRCCGDIVRQNLTRELALLSVLQDVAMLVKSDKGRTRERLQEHMRQITYPAPVSSVLDQGVSLSTVSIEDCKFMDSKKVPLWLVFDNALVPKEKVFMIFKVGDDLRQDVLTLQMMQVMNTLWLQADLDLALSIYGCVATGEGTGMIEVVLNSNTIANIQKEYGGATAALSDPPLHAWLSKHNTPEKMPSAIDNFTRSCAGYCVATYVLGIGDRHNDNIMLAKSGQLFHIDFGHFLGNIKRFAGIKRERTPFVFTPDMLYVMGGTSSPHYAKFVDLCGRAYNVLRRNAHTFINLFAMMLNTGIPELRSPEDINYLRDVLRLQDSDQEAAECFKGLIAQCLKDGWTTQLNWLIHNVVHGSSYLKKKI